MYSIKVRGDFNAAHNLRGYRGKCERLHGHNWHVDVFFLSETLDKHGMVLDFKKAKSALNKILSRLDHRYLNALPYFKKNNPSSENLARYIFERLSTSLKNSRYRLREVSVWETESSCATYAK